MYNKTTITAIGQTTPINLNRSDQITFAAKGDASDYVVVAEVRLNETGNWFPAQTLADNTLYSTITGALDLRFNCSSLGSATTIDLEISGAHV